MNEWPQEVTDAVQKAEALIIKGDRTSLNYAFDAVHNALDTVPDDPILLVILGRIFLKMQNNEAAHREFEKAAQLAPDFVPILLRSMNIEYTLGQKVEKEANNNSIDLQKLLQHKASKGGYIIVSGYFAEKSDKWKQDFINIWCENTLKYSQPQALYIINSNGFINDNDRDMLSNLYHCRLVDLTYNLGHVGTLLKTKAHKFCGWTMSTLIGALLAYSCNCDLIYKEQDCLAFGDWIDEMYRELDNKNVKMLFGQSNLMKIEQSLFIIKNDFLLDYVISILDISQRDDEYLPEFKFQLLKDKYPTHIGFLDFGYGRNRPINYDDPIFYIQQVTNGELNKLKEHKIKKLFKNQVL